MTRRQMSGESSVEWQSRLAAEDEQTARWADVVPEPVRLPEPCADHDPYDDAADEIARQDFNRSRT